MDNASKALIMAGAILISIAIVGVGVYIFSTTSSMGNTAGQQMDATQAQMTNSTLRQYEGKRVRGAQVRELMEYIEVLNTNDTLPADIKYSKFEVIPTAFYTVEFKDDNKDSYYDLLTIKENAPDVGETPRSEGAA